MLSFIGELFESVIQFLSSIWDFILHIGEEIAYLVDLLQSVVLGLPSFFVWLPASTLALLVALLGVCVLYKVLGRD